MIKTHEDILLSRRSVVGAAAALAFGSVALLTGCDSEKATVSKSKSSDKETDDKSDEQVTTDLAVGTTVDLSGGLSVTVDSVQTGLVNFDGSEVTGIHVTYTNNGDDGADYNVYDWKGEDANGAQQSETYYSEEQETLQSGTLAAGGSVAGNVYFDGQIVKALYFGNLLEKSATASWKLQ